MTKHAQSSSDVPDLQIELSVSFGIHRDRRMNLPLDTKVHLELYFYYFTFIFKLPLRN